MIRASPLLLLLAVVALAAAIYGLGGEADRSLTMAPDLHVQR